MELAAAIYSEVSSKVKKLGDDYSCSRHGINPTTIQIVKVGGWRTSQWVALITLSGSRLTCTAVAYQPIIYDLMDPLVDPKIAINNCISQVIDYERERQ